MAHPLPPLPYKYDALEPHYERATTLELHHGKHHQTYVDNLNKALEGHAALEQTSIEAILSDLSAVPSGIRTKVVNNGGGHYNHALFWTVMGPNKGGAPNGAISEVIDSTFGDFRTFKAKFKESALDLFGSGWTFLMVNQEGKVQIHNFPNQECPLSKGLKPVLLIDVWEHAYYLQFRNRRAEWVDAWWNVVNWDAVNALYLGREVLRLTA